MTPSLRVLMDTVVGHRQWAYAAVFLLFPSESPLKPTARSWLKRLTGPWGLFLGALLLIVSTPIVAQSPTDDVDQQNQQLTQIKREMDLLKEPSDATLNIYLKQLTAAQNTANECIQDSQKGLDKLNKERATLGPAKQGEPADVAQKRQSLDQDKAQLDKKLASCRLLLLKSQELNDRIISLQKARLDQFLLARGPNLWDIVRANLADPAQFWLGSKLGLLQDTGLESLTLEQVAVLIGLILTGLALGWGSWRLMTWAVGKSLQTKPMLRWYHSLLACTGPYMSPLLASALMTGYLAWLGRTLPALNVATQLSFGLVVYIVLLATIRILLQSCPPVKPCLPLPSDLAGRLRRRLRFLALLLLLGFMGYTALSLQNLPVYLSLLIRDMFALLLVLNLLWIIGISGQLLQGVLGLRLLLTLGVLIGLGAEWAGYWNLSIFIGRGLVLTLLGLVFTFLLSRLFTLFYDGLDEGRRGWQRRFRSWLHLKPGEPMPGLIWLRVLTGLLIWSGFALLAFHIWNPIPVAGSVILGYLTQGFAIGTFTLVPIRLPLAMLSFFLVVSLSSWIKQRLDQQWLKRTRLDKGAREAVVTITGYMGIGIAALVALSITGFDLAKLIIVAGALSVGIGFGLQNIVNNFVSGIILLFERPIRKGDWIEVGSVQGYVKNISIRSTQIETFDRADVIVPNSDLISGQVTNLTLRDRMGRMRIPIGVAYGSDTQKVKRILQELAEAHPLVVKKSFLVGPPKVLFLAFGDSSLTFELRCFITDINEKFNVLSDLNFAIDAAFRRQGIEIPFPQRDVHLRDWPPGGQVSPPGSGGPAVTPVETRTRPAG